MVLYDYDSNSIMAVPIKSRTDKAILDGYKVLHTRLCRAGLRPKLQRLDNECSQVLKDYMTEQKVDFQLVPPGVHCHNAAERAIRTFKTILLPDYAASIRISHSTCGTDSYRKRRSH